MFRRRSASDLHLVQMGSGGEAHGSFDPVIANRLSEVESAIFDASLSKLSSLSSMSRTDSRDISSVGLPQQYSLQSSMLGQQGSPLLLSHQHDPLPALLLKRGSSTFSQVGNQAEQQQMLQHQMLLHRRSSSTDTIASAVCSALKGRLSLELSSSGTSITETISSVVHAASSGSASESIKFGRRRVASADHSPVESESPQLFVETSPCELEADVGTLSPERTSWERLSHLGGNGRVQLSHGERLQRSYEFGGPKLDPRGDTGYGLQQAFPSVSKLGVQAPQDLSFGGSAAAQIWSADENLTGTLQGQALQRPVAQPLQQQMQSVLEPLMQPTVEQRGSLYFQVPCQMSFEQSGRQPRSSTASTGSSGQSLLTNDHGQQNKRIASVSYGRQSQRQPVASTQLTPDHIAKTEGVYEHVDWNSQDYQGHSRTRRIRVCRGLGSQHCEFSKAERGTEQFVERELLVPGDRLMQMQLRSQGYKRLDARGDALGSPKGDDIDMSEKDEKGLPGNAGMQYSGISPVPVGYNEATEYAGAPLLQSKGLLPLSTPPVEWRSAATETSASPFDGSGDELLHDRESPIVTLDSAGGCQRRQVPELTRGVKCVRGAARATVQQLYGQMYDLEALAVELDRANIDDLDPGDFDRSYHQGKRFAVGDLGRKLLLIVVREKLEAGACGQLKFLTLTDLFRLAHELGLWEFALKVAMAYKAGGLRIPKATAGPQMFTVPHSPRAETDCFWGSPVSGLAGGLQVCSGKAPDSELREIRRTRKSKRRNQQPVSALKTECSNDRGNVGTSVKGECHMPSDMQQD